MNHSNSDIFDAIVVGLGPGGSTAALDLARAGLSVLALDQARFPRDKPCGGGLTMKIDRILDHDFHSIVERALYGATVRFGDKKSLHVRSEKPVAYMVMRNRFDDFLVQKARRSGVLVKEGERARSVIEHDDGLEVNTSTGAYRGRFLVGADGTNSLVARELGFYRSRTKAVLLEGEIAIREMVLHGLEDEALLEFGHVPYGYGWIFPKADHLSIGVGGLGPFAKEAKTYYQKFVDRYDIFEETGAGKRFGYSLPVWTRRKRLTTQRAILIGDAAGLVDPFIGEGIYYAIRSGQHAAQSINQAVSAGAPDLSEYDKRIAQEIFSEFSVARKIALFVYLFPKIFRIGVEERNRELFENYLEVLRGDLSYQDFWQRAKKRVKSDLMCRFHLGKRPRRSQTAFEKSEIGEYGNSVKLWSTFLGKGAWAYLEDLVTGIVNKDSVVLDVETGTGVTTSMVLEKSQPARVISIDRSGPMLLEAKQKLKDPRLWFHHASPDRLPYRDHTFDLVISAWTLEHLPDPKSAATEFLRVVKDGGYVVYLFSSMPEKGVGKVLSSLISRSFSKNGDQQFLAKEEEPYHSCPRSSLVRFASGLITVVVLRKCCQVKAEALPHPRQVSNA